jgi:protein SCO1/2/putative membrane protein
VNASYRLGLAVVVGTVLASLCTCLVLVGLRPGPPPSAQDLGPQGFPLGDFRLVERSGRTVTAADLADRVAIASFVFTRCPLQCPKITSVMKGLQSRLAGSGVTLVSISVDPEHDTPAVLTDYARRFGADPDRWWFLTGPKDVVQELVVGRFKLPLRPAGDDEQQAGADPIVHSDRLALIDRGTVIGLFSSGEPESVAALVARAGRLDASRRSWVRRLPAVNAGLNATCAVLLALGWYLVRTRRVRGHRAVMIAAVVVSALFLACYLIYHARVGSVPFRGEGAVRVTYLTVLLSHTLLATFGVVPLVALTLNHALRGRFHRHAALAAVTFPIWMYVSITGVVIYLMLYQLPIAPPAGTL